MTAWPTLVIAGMLEIAFATSLKPSEGFTRLGPSLAVIVFGTAAVVTLTRSLDTIPVSTAYAVFTGIGAVGTVIVGILVFHERVTVARLLGLVLVIGGVVSLRLASPGG
jgi:quaternary ammonium compound-resistance protein SugE